MSIVSWCGVRACAPSGVAEGEKTTEETKVSLRRYGAARRATRSVVRLALQRRVYAVAGGDEFLQPAAARDQVFLPRVFDLGTVEAFTAGRRGAHLRTRRDVKLLALRRAGALSMKV